MTCPTCGQELEFVCTEADTVRHYHCLRCGTMVAHYEEDGKQNIYVPKLVTRCREFGAQVSPQYREPFWTTSGVAEAIHTPEERGTK